MTTLAQYTSPALIVPHFRSRNAVAVIGQLCALLDREQRLDNALSFFNAVMSHEHVASTVTSPGWALPHARVQGPSKLSFALARTAAPVSWFDHREESVRLVFLFAVPENEPGTYLSLLSALAKLSADRTLVDKLYGVRDGREMFELLQQMHLRHGPCGTARN